jgi:hypothetical protein
MTKRSGIDRVGQTKSDVNPSSVERAVEAGERTIREAIASLEAQGIRDWQILSAWSELLHERGEFNKGEVLSMATQMLVEVEAKQGA